MNHHANLSITSTIKPQLVDLLISEHKTQTLPRLERLWAYYRNELVDHPSNVGNGLDRENAYQVSQQQGLPRRLARRNSTGTGDRPHREIVIENDIAWRIQTLVDFMFGRSVALQSLAPDPQRAARIEQFLRAVIDANGGISFFQDMGLLGSVYGFVDVLVHVNGQPQRAKTDHLTDNIAAARRIVLEIVDPTRTIALLNVDDYRKLDAYILHFHQQTQQLEQNNFLARVRSRMLGSHPFSHRKIIARTHVWTPETFESFISAPDHADAKRTSIESRVNRLGRIPVVHIQNLPQPFFYEGLSEVEPLIPLQDELNTRLSDRANRVTFQSFKMYLGKGIENFTQRPVGPGQMWSTDNPDASIQEFGGDGHSPSEEAHIMEVREALDKTSGVSPVATGVVRDKVGNLTSENALRIVMMGLLAKTEKKRITYGEGIAKICELILHTADLYGILPNDPDDRRIRLDWPNPMPDSETQQLRNAVIKLDIGVPRKQILTELGYADAEIAGE